MALTMDSMHISISNIMANEASTETISVQTSSIRADIYSSEYIEKTTRVGGLEIKTSRGHMYLSHEPVRASAMSTWVRVKFLFPDQSRVLVLFLFHVNLLKICFTFIK